MQKLTDILAPLLLLLLFVPLFFTGLGQTVVIDYAEGAYAEVSRSMYERGEYVVPELNGEDFFEKPPMLYWLQLLGYTIFSVSSLGARFFNALCGLATLFVFYGAARAALPQRIALNASLILGSSIIYVYLCRVAVTEMALTFFLTLCLAVSGLGVERAIRDGGGAPLFWLGCAGAGLAMLSKGPIGVLFPVLTGIIYLLSIRRISIVLRKNWIIPGAVILALIGFSWYLLIGWVHPEGFAFMKELFLAHLAGRFSTAMDGHSGPIYYYLVVLLVGFMPWFSYLPIALIRRPPLSAGDSGGRFTRLFLLFSLVVLVYFSVAATKLPTSILPALPGLALLTALLFDQEHISRPRVWRLAGYLSALLPALLGLVLAAAPLFFPYLSEVLGEDARKAPVLAEPIHLGYKVWLAAALFFFSSFLIFRAGRQPRISSLPGTLLLCSFIHALVISFLILPLYDRLQDAPLARLARQAAQQTPAGTRILLYGIDDRPSINFTSGRGTIETSEDSIDRLAELLADPGVGAGIAPAASFNDLENRGYRLIGIERDMGYVLFRPAPNGPAPSGETPAPSPPRDTSPTAFRESLTGGRNTDIIPDKQAIGE